MDQTNKQYILLVDEIGMALLGRLCPGITYLEVHGMPINDNPQYQVLVNPLHIAEEKVVEEVPQEHVQ